MGVFSNPNNPADLKAQHQLSSYKIKCCPVTVIHQPNNPQAAKPTVRKANMADEMPSPTKRRILSQSTLAVPSLAAADSQIVLILSNNSG